MCGIAGLITTKNGRVDAADILSMSAAMVHRGPDDLGFLGWREGGDLRISRDGNEALQNATVAFAHRRLSIIDEGEGGWQPMATSDGRYAITYNGEIYNYLELKAELEAEGMDFATHSDTEVLLKALSTWGVEKTLPRLVGMFAFALLDTRTRTVSLARDPFGIKPLMYTTLDGDLAFASELGSLLTLARVSRRIQPQALYDYLRFGFTDRGAETLFDGIHHLPAAHFAVVSLDKLERIEPRRYWQAELKPVLDISFDEAAAQLRTLFMDSVALHLRADVPVGAALSGGIDSSAVVGAMRELEGPNLDLHTFTFVAPGADVNEEHWADMAAQHAHATQHKVSLSGQELVAELDGLISTQGEPFGTTSIFAQNRVFKLAANNGIKVTLDGQGADEILAGYVPFFAARLATLVKSGQWLKAVRFLSHMDGTSGVALRAARFILPQALQGPARRLVGEGLVPSWMNGEWFQAQGVAMQAPQKPVSGDVMRHELLHSLTDRILPSLLRYQDRNAMSHSVESRVPFLTVKMVEFLYSLPEAFLISDQGESKSVFRTAMRGIAPDPILDRRDKIGFATPEETWLAQAGGWLDDVLNSPVLQAAPAFEQNGVKREIAAVRAGDKRLTGDVWRWINLVRWAERFQVDFQR